MNQKIVLAFEVDKDTNDLMATFLRDGEVLGGFKSTKLGRIPLHSVAPMFIRQVRALCGSNTENTLVVACPPDQYAIIYPFLKQFKHGELTDPIELSNALNSNRLNHGKFARFNALNVLALQGEFGEEHDMVGKLGYDEPPFIKVVAERFRDGLTYFSLVHTKDGNELPFWQATKNIQGTDAVVREQLLSSLNNLVEFSLSKYPHIPISIVTTPEMAGQIGVKHGLFNYVEDCLASHFSLLNNNIRQLINVGGSRGKSAGSYRREIERFKKDYGTLNVRNRGNANAGKDYSFDLNKHAGGLEVTLRAIINRENQVALSAAVCAGGGVTDIGRVTKYRKSFKGAFKEWHKAFSVNGAYEHLGVVSIENHPELMEEFSGRDGLDAEFIEAVNDIKPKERTRGSFSGISAYVAVKDDAKSLSVSTSVAGVSSKHGVELSESCINKKESTSKNSPLGKGKYDKTLRRVLAVNQLLSSEAIPEKSDCRLYVDDFRTFCLISGLRGFCSTDSRTSKNAMGDGLHHALEKICDDAHRGGSTDGIGCFNAAIAIVNDSMKRNSVRPRHGEFYYGRSDIHVQAAIKELCKNLRRFKSMSVRRFKGDVSEDARLKELKTAVDEYAESAHPSKDLTVSAVSKPRL